MLHDRPPMPPLEVAGTVWGWGMGLILAVGGWLKVTIDTSRPDL